jgi:hypothetical protein
MGNCYDKESVVAEISYNKNKENPDRSIGIFFGANFGFQFLIF